MLSTGCSTATLAAPFLEAGASVYIAPTGDPYGPAPFMVVVTLYYHLLALGQDLSAAFEAARSVGGDTAMFALYD